MDVRVDPTLCEANARCVTAAPEVFALDDDEILHITPPGEAADRARIERAVASCPLNALSIRASDASVPGS